MQSRRRCRAEPVQTVAIPRGSYASATTAGLGGAAHPCGRRDGRHVAPRRRCRTLPPGL